MTYRRADTSAWERPLKEIGPVISTVSNDAVVFLCPCGGREVYVTSPPHGISFDADKRLTLDGSVGSKRLNGPLEFRLVFGKALHDLPENWCHFWVKGGEPEMCDGTQCPGGQ